MSYASDMVKVEGWDNPDGQAYILRGDQLVVATDEELARTAHNAMLLSQGAERAIEMHRAEATIQPTEPARR